MKGLLIILKSSHAVLTLNLVDWPLMFTLTFLPARSQRLQSTKMKVTRLISWLVIQTVTSRLDDHRYDSTDEVTVFLGSIGPLHNVQEKYDFSYSGLCTGRAALASDQVYRSLSDQLLGNSYIESGIHINYLEPVARFKYCSTSVDTEKLLTIKYLVMAAFYMELKIDGLPIWSLLGKSEKGKDLLATHRRFELHYNDDRIIFVNLTLLDFVDLDEPHAKIDLYYSVEWIKSNENFNTRFQYYMDTGFFGHRIKWLSILNSATITLLMTGLVFAIILKTVRNDYTRYTQHEANFELEQDFYDEYGWKLVSGDVFRRPPRLLVLSGLVGTGVQFLVIAAGILLYFVSGKAYEAESSILNYILVFYGITSFLSGYFAAKEFSIYSGNNWLGSFLFTILVWPLALCAIGAVINTVAILYSSTKAVAFTGMLYLFSLWMLVVVPLTLFGYLLGKSMYHNYEFPSRANPIPRQIPPKKWYFSRNCLILYGGIVPFGVIFVELRFILSAIW